MKILPGDLAHRVIDAVSPIVAQSYQRARDANPPTLRVKRRSCRGDPTLPLIDIHRAA